MSLMCQQGGNHVVENYFLPKAFTLEKLSFTEDFSYFDSPKAATISKRGCNS
jgi:hypothetical protein